MWTGTSDDELVKSSALIVEATYAGQSAFSPVAGASSRLTLGVLRVHKVLQGDPATELVFLRVPAIGLLRKSDDIVYTSGQHGLWFLRADDAYPGLYLADHPQRFVPDAQVTEKIRSIQEWLP